MVELKSGPPLLFDDSANRGEPVNLGGRKHLFIDDALIAEIENGKFVVNPPRKAERVLDNIKGPFRKHLTVVEDEAGLIRIYNSVKNDHLALNIDTDATGYAQVGILDEEGKPIAGYAVDDCIYVNGDFIDAKIEWLGKGSDISRLEGKTVQLVFRMRGSKLYAMQFVDR